MHTRPTNMVSTLPPDSFHRHRFGRVIAGTDITTIASHIVAKFLQVYPTVPAAVVVTSSAGAADVGRVVELEMVTDEYDLLIEQVVLNGAGVGTTLATNLIDAYRAKDRSDDAISAVGKLTATIGAIAVVEIAIGRGNSQCTRQWVPRGHVGYIQRVYADFETVLDDLAMWAWDIDGTWRAVTDLVAGSGTNVGNSISRSYVTPTSWGVMVQGPSRVEARAKASAASGTIIFEHTMLIVPDGQKQEVPE